MNTEIALSLEHTLQEVIFKNTDCIQVLYNTKAGYNQEKCSNQQTVCDRLLQFILKRLYKPDSEYISIFPMNHLFHFRNRNAYQIPQG